ncbi:MAG TPA: hypothetical protein PLN48_14275 [Lachnospiraceae bacterium]|nr:hypothetical protein [Lachnospiraceae bacterium]
MDKMLLEKRRNLQRFVSPVVYRDLTEYIKKIYLGDQELKVIMARKCSSLYLALIDLVRKDNGGNVDYQYKRKFSGKRKEPIIISDRALSIYKSRIMDKRNGIRNILLADDIIIHGRSLEEIYQLLKEWYKEAGISDYRITVISYADSVDGLIKDAESLKDKIVIKQCLGGEWHSVSDNIIRILYTMGQPYVSYVPYMRFSLRSVLGQKIERELSSGSSLFTEMGDGEKAYKSIETYVYVSRETKNWELSFTVRLYKYLDTEQFVLIPMVMLKPIRKDVLGKYFEELEKVFSSGDTFESLLALEDDTAYRTAVYLLSALAGWDFISKKIQVPITEDCFYNKDEEKLNFGQELIDDDVIKTISPQFIAEFLEGLNEVYSEPQELEGLVENDDEFSELINAFEKTLYEIRDSENKKTEPIDFNLFFSKFLFENGNLDEKYSKQENALTKRRLLGYPLFYIENQENFKNFREKWLKAVLSAIDYGKGSIVSKILNHDNTSYYFSVIHSGEENYKYLLNNYKFFLYGMLYIEKALEKRKESINEYFRYKSLFIDNFLKKWKEKHSYTKSDIEFLKTLDVSNEYKNILIQQFWDYVDNDDYNEAIEMAKTTLAK